MKNVALVLVVTAMLILVGIFVFTNTVEGYEEDTGFGSWESNVEVHYKDGSSQSLYFKPPVFSLNEIFHEDKEITSIDYNLRAKSTGEGFTSCEIDLQNFQVNSELIVNDVSKWTDTGTIGSTVEIVVNGDFVNIYNVTIQASDLDEINFLGDCKLFFYPTGDIRFRGLPDGSWADSKLPSIVFVSLERVEPAGNYELKVTTNPLNVDVKIYRNNVYVDRKNSGNYGDVYFELEPGTYKVQGSKSGYTTTEKLVTITDSDVYMYLHLPKKGDPPPPPPKYKLTVKTNPVGATVNVYDSGNKVVGTCSYCPLHGCSFSLEEGNYLVEGKGNGMWGGKNIYLSKAMTVTVVLEGVGLQLVNNQFYVQPRQGDVVPYRVSEGKYLGMK